MAAGLSGDGEVVYQLSVSEVDHPETIVTALAPHSRSDHLLYYDRGGYAWKYTF